MPREYLELGVPSSSKPQYSLPARIFIPANLNRLANRTSSFYQNLGSPGGSYLNTITPPNQSVDLLEWIQHQLATGTLNLPTGEGGIYGGSGSLQPGATIVTIGSGNSLTFDNQGGTIRTSGAFSIGTDALARSYQMYQTSTTNVPVTGPTYGAVYISNGTDGQTINHLIYKDGASILRDLSHTSYTHYFTSADWVLNGVVRTITLPASTHKLGPLVGVVPFKFVALDIYKEVFGSIFTNNVTGDIEIAVRDGRQYTGKLLITSAQ